MHQHIHMETTLTLSVLRKPRQSDGFSALHEAAFRGHDDIARLLLRWGANKDFATSVPASRSYTHCYGSQALMHCCALQEGTTALQLAVRHGNGVIAYMLCEGHSVDRGFY